MCNRTLQVVVCFALSLLAVAPCPAATDTMDREKIIDVAALTTAMAKATEPVFARMRSSNLKERFEQVQQILAAEQVDKEQLVSALRQLQAEIDTFTEDWDSVTAPLWEGQEALAETIDKVRSLLAGGQDASADPKIAKLLAGYDKRLAVMAKKIESEQDDQRRKRLKKVFASILALRRLTERLGGVNLGPATEALQVRIVQALSGLQDQLTQATFEVEKMRVVLTSESQFVSNYIDVVQGLIEAESLAKVLAQMSSDGTGLETFNIDVGELQDSAEKFGQTMNDFAGQLADSIEIETARLADELTNRTGIEDAEVDAEIRRYATAEVHSQATAGN